MLEKTTAVRLVLTTTATLDDARKLGRRLVEEHLVACATFIPAAESIYEWEGTVEESREVLILFKTLEDKLEALEARLNELHPYQAPEFLALPADSCGNKYLQWLMAALAS